MRLTTVAGSWTEGDQRKPLVDSTKESIFVTSPSENPVGKEEWSFLHDCPKLYLSSISTKCPQYFFDNIAGNFIFWPEALMIEPPLMPPLFPPLWPPRVAVWFEPSLLPRPPPSLPPRLLVPPRPPLSLLARWWLCYCHHHRSSFYHFKLPLS